VRDAIVEDALRQAIGGASTASATGVVPLASARRRWLPWTVAASSALVAAAALIALFVRPPAQPATAAPDVPVAWRSRPADALIGAIAPEHAADADTRIDAIFADRLDGFRERRLGGLP
jgi:hypothetical protein